MGIATVYLSGIASASVRVEIEDGLEPHEARLAALDAALDQGVPGLCHQCAGYMRTWSREDPGEWGITDWSKGSTSFAEVPLEEAVDLSEYTSK